MNGGSSLFVLFITTLYLSNLFFRYSAVSHEIRDEASTWTNNNEVQNLIDERLNLRGRKLMSTLRRSLREKPKDGPPSPQRQPGDKQGPYKPFLELWDDV